MSSQGRDLEFMEMAYSLAEKARGRTSPNPCVGAVVVKAGQIVGWGYHQEAGKPHAEIEALERAGRRAIGATLYLTLEPCVHWGRTPPCVDRLLQTGLKRVVVSAYDPNPLVNKKGVARLRQAGIKVETGLLGHLNIRLNESYIKYITARIPFVTLKAALSLDGKMAAASGDSRWISCPESRYFVQNLRAEHDGILVGINTILKDDPELTLRLEDTCGKKWHRVVLDTHLRFPAEARLLKNLRGGRVIIFAGPEGPEDRAVRLRQKGAEIIRVPATNGQLDLKAVLEELGRREISSVLVEGGAGVLTSFIQQKLADKVYLFFSPRFIGGEKSPTPFEGRGAETVAEALELKKVRHFAIRNDIIVEGYF
ncbi:MAG: bifunctional diaminohydroxyphosphoribosylaminopyrimidine deaminase/5-amino-6-(5-phosphoribosylamino)uracil reductase RibD [Candidatus Saccharicenans sp.]|jgi:diaminohydroxyphosphoribosylaminopyrimidine deaminase/5-amino-6-(5-phosphoribosylamino)uracil reductase|nr:bifunctional diaminohydroxyphosphoribosylaminopyrimidine deaminase/5-amino-6-(5-phosphoribosylamino)uracil reductase RibD [Candidatus Saccharicenans sp.]MDH7575379.1 bifunctional diaminohydroxyphosphoribosylaminopyrimidine deaminase/5-amino-6-(5-phosphoribosylamino)uracil reductase RibD [Candidatus Saccharicenans sp.]